MLVGYACTSVRLVGACGGSSTSLTLDDHGCCLGAAVAVIGGDPDDE